ncbi:hypothetical protein A2W78_00055 [Candidatus Nomurabacteria bacterium RIFCSPLOWO2_12_40_14]|nr:MAG: hypothetical protein A2W12_00035 [Candidatus Nomurabacteria bacterium RBG_16_40_11]OGI71910.1 MAG: hypothetical protein A2W56_03010 [Candidatus Nomurabacteria bacterium RIFCSPHIGHO2_02_41_18]OGI98484.1 MAG: hypothetical protein A2W78_00055 [Candidatus Nomurabacteria bacterium RIFCSPLOWO2_12_40_14]
MQKRTLTQIKKDLKELSEKGWIKSNRKHNTGIGKTLEDYLGITENNIALPDFGVMELKSQRINTISMMTLFTKSPEGITNSEIRKRFGYPDPEFPKIKILHQTISDGMTGTPNLSSGSKIKMSSFLLSTIEIVFIFIFIIQLNERARDP